LDIKHCFNCLSPKLLTGYPLIVDLFSSETVSSLLCYPSAALQKLVPSVAQSAIVNSQTDDRPNMDILSRPVLVFLLQHHNLHGLQLAMKQALRKATCRIYAMQVCPREFKVLE
jgi:hypothetical protein